MDDLEFWRLSTVVQKVGLSKTEIYRRIKKGTFPKARLLPGSQAVKFWSSHEIRSWQRDILAMSAFEDLFE